MLNYGQPTQDHEPKRPVSARVETLEAAVADLGGTIADLRRRNGLFRWLVAIAAVGGACLGALGAVVVHGRPAAVSAAGRETTTADTLPARYLGKTLEVERIVLKDRGGAVRATLGVDEGADEKPVTFELLAGGKPIARLGGHSPGDVELSFPGEPPEGGVGRAWIGLASGEGAMGLADARHRVSLRIFDTKDGAALSMTGKDGIEGLELFLNSGCAMLRARDHRTGKLENVLYEGELVARPKPE